MSYTKIPQFLQKTFCRHSISLFFICCSFLVFSCFAFLIFKSRDHLNKCKYPNILRYNIILESATHCTSLFLYNFFSRSINLLFSVVSKILLSTVTNFVCDLPIFFSIFVTSPKVLLLFCFILLFYFLVYLLQSVGMCSFVEDSSVTLCLPYLLHFYSCFR